MFKLDLEKAEEPKIKLLTSTGSQRKQENSRKTYTSASLTILKSLTVWITTNCGKFLKRWEYQTTVSTSWEICMQDKKQQLESDRLVPNWERSTSRLYCHLVYLTYMQSTSCEMPDQMKHKLESRLLDINNLRYANDTTLMAESEEELKSLLNMKEENEKVGLKLTFRKRSSWHPVLSVRGKQMEKIWKQCQILSWAPKSMQTAIAATKFKNAYSLEEQLCQTYTVF